MTAIVETRSGRLEGRKVGTELVFLGIPYAAPPAGPLRWLPPAPVEPWSGVRKALAYGSASCQNTVELATLPILAVEQPTSEDCLYLNVWTQGADDARRPVMVWIHGGAFTIGAGAQLMPSTSSLVRRGDVVLVTINYRLGALGFLNLNEVTNGRIPASGNEGLLDQAAALEWVRDNIAAFGGDPDNVTIFGESAGGMSVGSQLALPAASGLFHKAIPQSGACHTANTLQRAVAVGERVTRDLGTRDPDQLRAVSVERLMEVQAGLTPLGATAGSDPELGGMPLQPCVDGEVLPDLPIRRVGAGSAAGIPLLVGSTRDEWKLFGALDPATQTLDDEGLRARLADIPGADGLIAAYRDARAKREQATSPAELFMAIATDRMFRMPGVRLVETQRPHESRVYSYLVTWPSPLMGGALGSPHAVELGPLFGNHDLNDATASFFGKGPAADALSVGMQQAWTSFARSGDPSSESLGAWPAYTEERRATMILGEECRLEDGPLDDERRAWDSVPAEVLGNL